MFSFITEKMQANRIARLNTSFINEEADDVLAISNDAMAMVDDDSVPEEAMEELDKLADKIVNKEGYDDTDITELVGSEVDPTESMAESDIDSDAAVISGSDLVNELQEAASRIVTEIWD